MNEVQKAKAAHLIASMRLERFRAENWSRDWTQKDSSQYINLFNECRDASLALEKAKRK